MKIRTDFVTNSSSSCYCVSYSVATNVKNKGVYIDFWPNGVDNTGDILIGMKNGVDEFVDAVKKCKSVDELISTIINEVELDNILENWETEVSTNEELFEKFDEILGKEKSFKNELVKAKELSDIKTVSVVQYYTGWGEYARDGVANFMNDAITEKLDWHDEDAVIEALSDRFTKREIKEMINQVQNDTIYMFDASITTTIDLATGEVTKKYEFNDFG